MGTRLLLWGILVFSRWLSYRGRYSTTTLPFIDEWNLQKYS